MAPPRKPAERRQRRNTPGIGLVGVGSEVIAPDPPSKWLAGTKQAWVEFWGSPQAGLVMPADRPALLRLFTYRDELERCRRGFDAQRFVKGAAGQDRLNPLGDHALKLERSILALEDRFGLTPNARLRLGVVFGQAVESLEGAMAAAMADEADDEPDPRMVVIDVG